jgi:hypothetical protein
MLEAGASTTLFPVIIECDFERNTSCKSEFQGGEGSFLQSAYFATVKKHSISQNKIIFRSRSI